MLLKGSVILHKVYLIEPLIGYPVIHQFRGNRVDNSVDNLWETASGGGKLD